MSVSPTPPRNNCSTELSRLYARRNKRDRPSPLSREPPTIVVTTFLLVFQKSNLSICIRPKLSRPHLCLRSKDAYRFHTEMTPLLSQHVDTSRSTWPFTLRNIPYASFASTGPGKLVLLPSFQRKSLPHKRKCCRPSPSNAYTGGNMLFHPSFNRQSLRTSGAVVDGLFPRLHTHCCLVSPQARDLALFPT